MSRTQPLIDQVGRAVVVPSHPQRIVSLVPSQTELLIDLGAPVVGRSKFCIHPTETVTNIPTVGGTKQFDFDKINALRPDLIIGNKEENYQEGIEQLAATYPVWLSDIKTLDDALAMITSVGTIVNAPSAAQTLITQITNAFSLLVSPSPSLPKVAYFIWRNPWMVVGADTFIDDMLTRCGFVNAFADRTDSRYPIVTVAELAAADLDALLFSTEPYPFHQERFTQELEGLLPTVSSLVVDGELFSWYGSRLVVSAEYFHTLIARLHPSNEFDG